MFSAVGLEPCNDTTQPQVIGLDPSVLPNDVATLDFQSDDDVRHSMLAATDVATVISSYEKTVGVCCSFLLLFST